jgi:MoaA/NifB/PqqE/SkfB family radical SAM enzyme
VWEKQGGRELSFVEWKQIINRLYDKGITVAAVEGGEPTLYPYASEIVDYIRRKGIYCIFITNGTRDISTICPDVFWISIDGMQLCHDQIRGNGVFKKVVDTIEKNGHRRIISLTSLSKSNVQDIEPLCDFFSPRLTGLMFNFTYPYQGIDEESLTSKERKSAALTLLTLKKKYPRIINSDSYLKEVGESKSMHPWLLTTVTSDGKEIQGCMVRHLEAENCSLCDMGCCSELSKIYELKRDAIRFWNSNFGLPRLI